MEKKYEMEVVVNIKMKIKVGEDGVKLEVEKEDKVELEESMEVLWGGGEKKRTNLTFYLTYEV